MGFIGSVSRSHRAILADLADAWKGQPIYVGCSGNFTFERALANAGHTQLFSNDVSLYSCALGRYLTRQPVGVTVADPALDWLSPYLDDGLGSVAAILLCTSMLDYYDRPEFYHRRMWAGAVEQFAERHDLTRQPIEKAVAGLQLAGFIEADVRDFLRQIPPGAAFISYPPTHKRGYERLYKKLDSTFAWDAPPYETFGPKDLPALFDLAAERGPWAIGTGTDVDAYSSCHRATVQETRRAAPMYLYASVGDTSIVWPKMKTEPVTVPRLRGQVRGPLTLARLTPGQLNTLRSEHLNPGISPALATVALAILDQGELLGVVAFISERWNQCESYLMSDFPVAPTDEPRLSKLVLAVALSTEVQALLEQAFTRRVTNVMTTAFTERSASMKYRGLFTLIERKEKPARLLYRAAAGAWNLEGALQWWRQKYSHTPTPNPTSSGSTPSSPTSPPSSATPSAVAVSA